MSAIAGGLLMAWTTTASAATGVSVDSLSLDTPLLCPGDPATLTVVGHNNQTYALNSGDAHLYVKLERSSTHGNGVCPTGFNQTPERDAWWMVDGASNPLIAQDPYKWNSTNPTWPNNSGYAVPGIIPASSAFTVTFKVQLPPYGQQGVMYNTAYQFHVGSKTYNQSAADADQYSCLPFTTCSPPPSSSRAVKRADGTAANGNTMLYWVDYEFFNSPNNWVSDVLPPCLTYLGAAPQPYDGSPAVWDPLARRVSWRIQNSNSALMDYAAVGSLYIRVDLSGCSGDIVNTAEYCYSCSASGPFTATNTVDQKLGGPNVLLQKSQETLAGNPIAENAQLADGTSFQYVLEYTLSGDALRCFEPFDTVPVGTYNVPSGGAAGFGAWAGDNSGATTWKVVDNGYGDRNLTFAGSGYHALLLDCPAAATAGQFCGGTVQVDMRHDQASDPNADALLVLRSDGLSNGNTYALLITGDENPSVGSHFKIQRCSGGGCTYANAGNNLPALDGSWYTVKAVEVPGQPGHILAKFWARGTPEPANWMINWSDPGTPFSCTPASGGHYRPGVGGQAAKDDYDNFRVYSSNQLINATLYDSIPLGVDYVSSNPLASGLPANNNAPGDMVRWDFTGGNYGAIGGALFAGSGAFTWVARTRCADLQDHVANRATLSGQILPQPPLAADSNIVHLLIDCGSPTDTPTFTFSPTRTPTPSATPTRTPTATSTASPTATPSATPSPTASVTPTATPTRTPSATPTESPTRSDTPTATATFTASVTASATPTATPSVTPSPSRTASPTATPTFTATPSATISDTPPSTPTSTPTPTQTLSFTPSPTPTHSPTKTSSPTQSVTFTPSPTLTATPTSSPSFSPSPTPSLTPSVTATPTASPSRTPSATSTVSPSSTATPSTTPTRTPSSTPSATPSITVTATLAPTPVPVPYHLLLGVYNSAGERVRMLFNGGAQTLPAQLRVAQSLDPAGNLVVSIGLAGQLYDPVLGPLAQLLWDGKNDGGQQVSGGVYTLKAELIDQWGSITSLTASVQKLAVNPENELLIFNSAGEIVARPTFTPVPGGRPLTGLWLDKETYAGGLFRFNFVDESGATLSLDWDGLNAQGVPVASGSYLAQLVYRASGGQGAMLIQGRSFTVLREKADDPLAQAVAVPAPLHRGQALELRYPPAQPVTARLYALDGSLVAVGADPEGTGRLSFSSQSLATGVYVIQLQRSDRPNGVHPRLLKVAVLP